MKNRFYFLSVIVTLSSLVVSSYIVYDYFNGHKDMAEVRAGGNRFLLDTAMSNQNIDKKIMEEAEPDLISPLEENIPALPEKHVEKN